MLIVDPKNLTKPQFVCAVYWMEGLLSQGDIANRIGWKPAQVRGWIWRSFDPPRHAMSNKDRQRVLDDLSPLRRELGVMEASDFDGRFQAKRCRTAPREPEPTFEDTPEGRKAERKYRNERRKSQHKDALGRKRGHAKSRGANSSALEWLDLHRHLRDATDRHLMPGERNTAVVASSMRRVEAGMRLRKYIRGSQVSPLGAMDYEQASMSDGGAGTKLSLPEFRLHCIHTLGSIRQMMQDSDFALIEAVVENDRFIWDEFRPRSKDRDRVFEAIRYLLDIIACHEGLLTHSEFEEIWEEVLPDPLRPSKRQAAEVSRRAEELFRNGQS